MPHGVRVWDESANLVLDSGDYIKRMIWSLEVGVNASGSQVISLPTANCSVTAVNTSTSGSYGNPPHKVTLNVATGEVAWARGYTDIDAGPSLIIVFAHG